MEDHLTFWAPQTRHTIHYCPQFPEVVSFEAAWTPTYFTPALLFLGLGVVTGGLGLATVGWLGRLD